MKHKNKIKLAHKLRTFRELKSHISIWLTENWTKHKQAIQTRVSKSEANAKEASRLRKLKLSTQEAKKED